MVNIKLLLFINRLSGAGFGTRLSKLIESRSDAFIIQLPEEISKFKSLGYETLHSSDLKVVVCGGDGTINWVVSVLSDYYGAENETFRPPLAVVPVGTGNDMSHMLGWGTKYDAFDLANIDKTLDKIKGREKYVDTDMWEVSITEMSNTKDATKNYTMLNYFSIGVDANIANDFAFFRKEFPQLFVTHTLSKLMYVPATFGSLVGQDTLDTYLSGSITLSNGNEKVLNFTDSSKTFICQAISSIYGGIDLWKNRKNRSINDGKFEVMEQGGFWSLAFSQIGINLAEPVGQATKVSLRSSRSLKYQIDGEPGVTHGPSIIEVKRKGSYPMLFAK